MSSPSADRVSLQELWRARLKDAELEVAFTRHFFDEVQRGFPGEGGMDEALANRCALRLESLALAKYRRVLRIYSDLVLRNKIPDEG